ncbi:MAG: C-terminal binding protein [Verrucomicrobiales bacterium]|nr:C-terminal binding protein [Verrucomicrobiales bacterium]
MAALPKVVITDLIVEPLDYERRILDGHAEVIALDARSEDELIGQIEDADAVMVYHYFRFTRASIERLERCRVIVRPGVGYDGIDCAFARERGIPVCNVPDYGTEEVADSALAMALSLTRGSHFLNSRLRRGIGEWNVDEALPLPRLRGQVYGIVGCGRIGTATALRAKAFGFDVVFYDPYLADGVDKALGLRRVDTLEELLRESFVVSIHCPLTEETRGMVGASEIAEMETGAYLVNNARGGVVDTDAVVEALSCGQLAGAGIDVLEQEPPDESSLVLQAWRDPDHPAHDRLILNPHTAFYCDEGCEEFRTKGAAEVLRALRGEPLRNIVN